MLFEEEQAEVQERLDAAEEAMREALFSLSEDAVSSYVVSPLVEIVKALREYKGEIGLKVEPLPDDEPKEEPTEEPKKKE